MVGAVRLARSLPLVPAFVLVLAAPVVTLAPLARAEGPAKAGTMDIADVKPGMKGYGLTVFKGTDPEKFDIEVVGILSKFRPNQDLILIKTPHERLNIAHTVAGMSGSPIFLDGKMIGAYAYGWQFGSEPIAGVTPIKNMLQDLARPVPPNLLKPIPEPPPARRDAPQKAAGRPRGKRASNDAFGQGFDGLLEEYDLKKHGAQLGERVGTALRPPQGSALAPASTMMSIAGMGDRTSKVVTELMAPLGFDTLQGGGAGTGTDPNAPTRFVDGGAIGVQLVRGDISAMGIGTVTRVEGDKLVAFGHPMMHGGVSALPTAIGKVHWILASQARSFKIGEAARPLGTLVNDQQASIVVDSNVQAPVFPVTVEVEGVKGAPKTSWSMEVAHDRFLSPTFVGVAMGNTVESTISEKRDATWRAKTKITVKGYGTIEVEDFGLAIGGTPNADEFVRSRATRAVGQILNNPWEWAQIEKVEMKISFTFGRDILSIRGAHPLEDTVDAGQKVRIEVRLWQFNGPDDVRTLEVTMPKELAGRDVDIMIVPGWMDGPDLPTPENLGALIANLPRSSFAPDALIAVFRLPEHGAVFKGNVVSRLPASALDTLRGTGSSEAPETIATLSRHAFPIGKFVDGRDHVRVRVREVLRLRRARLPLPSSHARQHAASRDTETPMIRSSLLRTSASVLTAAAALLGTHTASAVGTRSFELTSQDDFLGGDLHGVAVDSQGHVRAGWNLGTATLTGATSVWSSVVLADGSVLLGTGSNGKVLRVSGGQVSEYADTQQMAVTSMVTDGKVVYAATLKGKIWKLEAAGKATELASIPDGDHILAMAWDPKKNGFYAATGPNGKLFFVTPAGQASLVFDSDETQLSAVAVAEDGTVYAGSTGKGLVYKITGPGRAAILLDCPGDEVKAIAVKKGGAIFVAANDIGDAPEPPRRPQGAGFNPPGPAPMARTKVGKGVLLRIDPDGKSEELLTRKDTHFVSLALDDAGAPFVGTAAEGRVYTVDENHTSTLVADTDERQIGTIVLAGKTRFIASSDPAVFHEIRGTGGADATWTSKVLDAGARATFGRLVWRADGGIELSTRTGNSATPDATWSEWSAAVTAPSKTSSPPGRFVQIRARFSKDAHALLRNVELPFVTDNARAIVTTIDARPRSGGSSSSPSSSGGSGASGALPSSGAEIPARVSGLKVTWKTDNPDGDQLRYRVQFRFDGHSAWRDLTKPDDVLVKNELEWDTASLPEGVYRIRVEATDETSNPPDRVTRHSLESGPVLVDNTPPVFRALSATGKRLRADIVDGLGPIVRIDFAVDGRTEWRPLLPKDGVADEPTEEIDVDLSTIVGAGSHLVAVRAFDRAGNYVVRDIELKLAADRGPRRRATPRRPRRGCARVDCVLFPAAP